MPKPQKEYLNNCKVANFISSTSLQSSLLGSTLQLKTLPKKNIFVTVDLTADENLELSSQNITQYDLAVMDAVYTLMVNGATAFTPEMVARIMSGNLNQDVTPQKSGAVTKSLRKLSVIRISIECTAELRQRKVIAEGQTARLTSYLMPIREIEVRSANHQAVMRGYQLIEKPVLYTYGEAVHQIIDVRTDILSAANMRGRLSDTDDVIIIKRALIRRIETLKNPKSRMTNETIRYEYSDTSTGENKGFFTLLGFAASDYKNTRQWAKKRLALHKMITVILDDFTKADYISGYEVIKEEKQKIVGVKLRLA